MLSYVMLSCVIQQAIHCKDLCAEIEVITHKCFRTHNYSWLVEIYGLLNNKLRH